VNDVPAATRQAQVRLAGKQPRPAAELSHSAEGLSPWAERKESNAFIFDLRIDADYVEPAGGFKPVKIKYVWEEGDAVKSHVHVARSPSDTFKITCGPGAVVKSYSMELAQ
jgi:hypothetical protein